MSDDHTAADDSVALVGRILDAYDLKTQTVRAAGGTAGQTWRAEADNQSCFVRRRGQRTATPQRIAFDHGLRRHLSKRGFCATPPMHTTDGQTYVTINDAAYEVYPWVDGLPLTDDLTDKALRHAARTLAQFHELASTYDAPCEPVVPQFSNFETPIAPRRRVDDPAAFLDVIDHMIATYATSQNRAALVRAHEHAQWLNQAYDTELYQSLPRHVIHGDYHGDNMLFASDGDVVGLFDFDWAWRDVRVRDLADAVIFFGARRSSPPVPGSIWSLTELRQYEIAPMLEVVGAYHAASPLNAAERRALPLAILARWVGQRTEGIMKVPPQRRAEFLLKDFDWPFEWLENEGKQFVQGLRDLD